MSESRHGSPAAKTPIRRAAEWLAGHATRLMPAARADWASAMRRETDHLAEDRNALAWALGCVFASYKERMKAMDMDHVRVSRGVLALEMLVCFAPLAMLCLGLLTGEGFTGPLPHDAWFVRMLASSLLGPVGLALAAAIVCARRVPMGRASVTLLGILAACTLLGLGLPRYGDFFGSHALEGAWRDFVLLAALPVVGALHLVALAASGRARS